MQDFEKSTSKNLPDYKTPYTTESADDEMYRNTVTSYYKNPYLTEMNELKQFDYTAESYHQEKPASEVLNQRRTYQTNKITSKKLHLKVKEHRKLNFSENGYFPKSDKHVHIYKIFR